MIRLFLSYRRKDSSANSRSLYQALEKDFIVFHNIDKDHSIPYGSYFPYKIKEGIRNSDIFLILIGKEFINEIERKKNDNQKDYVLEEILYAKELKKDIIPVLVDGADMPQKNEIPKEIRFLTDIDAFTLTHEKFHQDIQTLIKAIRKLFHKDILAGTLKNHPKNFSFIELEKYLKERNWQKASNETINIFLKQTKRKKDGWMREKDIENIPCDFILYIERLWSKYSAGKFCFEKQLEIYQENGFNLEKYIGFLDFCEHVEWKTNENYIFLGNENIEGSFPLPICEDNDINIKNIALRAILNRYKKCKEQLS